MLKLYVALISVLSGLNVPVPELDQYCVPEETDPESKALLFAHVIISEPALTAGAEFITTVIVSIDGGQEPLFVDVSIKSKLPAILSAWLTKYVAFKVLSLGIKLPLPVVDHIPVLVEPVILPFKLT